MATALNITPQDQQQREKKLRAKMEMAILGLEGIFWALNMLVVNETADDIVVDVHDRESGIAT